MKGLSENMSMIMLALIFLTVIGGVVAILTTRDEIRRSMGGATNGNEGSNGSDNGAIAEQ